MGSISFDSRYTTAERVAKDTVPLDFDGKPLKDYIPESSKTVLSNDAYAIGLLLDELIRQVSFRMR